MHYLVSSKVATVSCRQTGGPFLETTYYAPTDPHCTVEPLNLSRTSTPWRLGGATELRTTCASNATIHSQKYHYTSGSEYHLCRIRFHSLMTNKSTPFCHRYYSARSTHNHLLLRHPKRILPVHDRQLLFDRRCERVGPQREHSTTCIVGIIPPPRRDSRWKYVFIPQEVGGQ